MKCRDFSSVLRTFADVLHAAGALVARDQILMFAAVFDPHPTSSVSDLAKRVASLGGSGPTGSPSLGDVARLLSALKGFLNKIAKTSVLTDVDTIGWTQRFDLLSDPNRLEILLVLHRAPGTCVGDLAAVLGRSENAVSQALRVLRQQGWVSSTRVGRAVSYRLEDEIVHDLLHWIGARHS